MKLEHVNICVPDPKATAAMLCDLFGWHVRWEGPAIVNGYTVHVGDDDSYLALYAPARQLAPEATRYTRVAGLNHIGIVVDRRSGDTSRPLIVHNIGFGPKLEDLLFAYRITGHYRYPRR